MSLKKILLALDCKISEDDFAKIAVMAKNHFLAKDAAWEEGKHKRAANGEFGSGSFASKMAETASKKAATSAKGETQANHREAQARHEDAAALHKEEGNSEKEKYHKEKSEFHRQKSSGWSGQGGRESGASKSTA